MENPTIKIKLADDLEKIVLVINELIQSGIEFLVDAKAFILHFFEMLVEKIFTFFKSIISKKELIDLLDFKEDDLFV